MLGADGSYTLMYTTESLQRYKKVVLTYWSLVISGDLREYWAIIYHFQSGWENSSTFCKTDYTVDRPFVTSTLSPLHSLVTVHPPSSQSSVISHAIWRYNDGDSPPRLFDDSRSSEASKFNAGSISWFALTPRRICWWDGETDGLHSLSPSHNFRDSTY